MRVTFAHGRETVRQQCPGTNEVLSAEELEEKEAAEVLSCEL
jgi:hypothetical protein